MNAIKIAILLKMIIANVQVATMDIIYIITNVLNVIQIVKHVIILQQIV